MSLYRYFVNYTRPGSWNYRLRQARLRLFLQSVDGYRRPVKVLDVGGSVYYWDHIFFAMEGVSRSDFEITITNIDAAFAAGPPQSRDHYCFVQADARRMPQFSDVQFDIVHSNSVIEHVGNLSDMSDMAFEIRRIGKRHFIQTPNYWFPIEPHFQAPFFHWLPRALRAALVRRLALGHLPRARDARHAEQIVDSAQLVTHGDLRRLFPGSTIYRERLLGLTKSFIVTGGAPA